MPLSPFHSMERTFVMVKPDGVEKNVIGDCVHRLEKGGLKILAAKLISVSKHQAEQLYEEHKGKPFYDGLVEFALSGPAFPMVVEGENAVKKVRDIIGPTDPKKAPKGTIRGDYGTELPYNIMHASDAVKSAEREIKIFFKESEIISKAR